MHTSSYHICFCVVTDVLQPVVNCPGEYTLCFRLCPSFVLAVIREIYKARDSLIIPGLLRSLDHVISLTCREMDSEDCAALIFTLKHSDRVRLNLLWTSIPAGETESILFTLDKVSQLRSDISARLSVLCLCQSSPAHRMCSTSPIITNS